MAICKGKKDIDRLTNVSPPILLIRFQVALVLFSKHRHLLWHQKFTTKKNADHSHKVIVYLQLYATTRARHIS